MKSKGTIILRMPQDYGSKDSSMESGKTSKTKNSSTSFASGTKVADSVKAEGKAQNVQFALNIQWK